MHGHRARAMQRKAVKELKKTSKWAARELHSLEALHRHFIHDAREAVRLERYASISYPRNALVVYRHEMWFYSDLRVFVTLLSDHSLQVDCAPCCQSVEPQSAKSRSVHMIVHCQTSLPPCHCVLSDGQLQLHV